MRWLQMVLCVCWTGLLVANGAEPRQSTAWTLSSDALRIALADNGTIAAMEVKQEGQWEKISFRSDAVAGPSLALIDASPVMTKARKLEEFPTVKLTRVGTDPTQFAGLGKYIQCRLGYRLENGRLSILVSLKNTGPEVYSPLAARMVLGIDCEMARYPDWNEIYFPTLLRCEKTHCWGYLMTPRSRILTIGSPDPVASYAMNYKATVWGNGNGIEDMCLRIHSCSLDLLHGQPLPQRHPQEMTALKPGEERSWRIYLQPANSLEQVKTMLATSLAAPMIDCDRYTVAEGENCRVTIHGAKPEAVSAIAPDGKETPLSLDSTSLAQHALRFAPQSGPGVYTLKVKDPQGHVAEACVSVRHPWSWYMNQARKESYHHKQYASSHQEQWMGLYTQALARRHLPDPALDPEGDKRLREILALQWDLEKKTPLANTMPFYRLFPGTAQMAGLLAYRYMADGDRYWLDLAGGFADYCIGRQLPNGNMIDYTSAFYPVKSILEVAAAEKMAMDVTPQMKENHARHYAAAKKAIDFLVRQKDNVRTEGSPTFEDAMIVSSGMQIGLFALLQKDPAERQKYAEASKFMLQSHRCLEQQLISDSRMNGASLRKADAQYDALIRKSRNVMNSPQGYSGYLICGQWYQYLLTGEEQWLNKTMNALGSCVQLVDSKTGELRWGFVADPYVEISMLEPNPANPMRGKRMERVVGEQYLPMIAAFHYPDKEPVKMDLQNGWTCCNDVHDIFIALEEVALTSAYVIERADGSIGTSNCTASLDSSGKLTVQPAEQVVSRIHLNLKKPHPVEAKFAKGQTVSGTYDGMTWIGPGGVPELIR